MYKHQLVRSLVSHFASEAGVLVPVRVFTKAALFEKYTTRRAKQMVPTTRAQARDGYAISYANIARPVIFFNLAKHERVAEVADTAAHEIVHVRWPSLAHGELFTRRVKALLSGYRCGPKGTRLPVAFR